MRKVLIAACAALAAPGLVAAACPVAQDLENGIFVTDDEGSVTRYQAGDTYILEHTEYSDSDEGYTYRTASGLLILSYTSTEKGEPVADTAESYTYSKDPHGMEVAEESFWQARVVTEYVDGSDDLLENYTLAMGSAREISIGECTYTAIPVSHISYFVSDPEFSIFTQDHIPSLGISLASGYWDLVSGFERYENHAISTTAPASFK